MLRQRIAGSNGFQIAPPSDVAKQLCVQFPWDPATEQYFTLLYGILDVQTREFRFISAGHPAPVYHPHGAAPQLIEASGFPIGLIESDYEERRLSLNPGDRLYLYSDGVTEAFNAADQQFGTEGLLAALGPDHTGPLDQTVKSLVGRVEAWGGPPRDDLSVLALEIDVHGSTQA